MPRLSSAPRILCFALLFFAARSASANCPAQLAVTGPDGNGIVTVNASTSGNCGGTELQVFIDGTLSGGKNCNNPAVSGGIQPTCQDTFSFNANCWTGGAHTVELRTVCHTQNQEECERDTGSSTQSVSVNNKPTVSLSVSPSSGSSAIASINAGFPNTVANRNRVRLYRDGVSIQSFNVPEGQHNFSIDHPLNMECDTGSQTYHAEAYTCGATWGAVVPDDRPADESLKARSADVSFQPNSSPTVSVSAGPPGPTGSGTANVSYNFPGTTSSNRRRLELFVDGTRVATHQPAEPSGVWPAAYSVECLTPGGHDLTVKAFACGNNSMVPAGYPTNPLHIDEDATSVTAGGPPTVGVSYNNQTHAVTIDYAFPNTGSTTDRSLTVQIDDGTVMNMGTSCRQQSGVCTTSANFGCSTGPHRIRVTAKSCGKTGSNFVTERTIAVAPPECPRQQTECSCSTRQAENARSSLLSAITMAPPTPSGGSVCVGAPVNVGSGNVSVDVPLFTIGQEPLPLSFGLAYHSSKPAFSTAVSYPLGPAWTHSFNMSLRSVGPERLMLITSSGDRQFFDVDGTGTWAAARPVSSRNRVALQSGEYVLSHYTGGSTRFSAATGRWLATTDRWQNSITGSYDAAGNLTTITDSAGRQITLTYSGSLITQIALPNGATWRFEYSGPGSWLARIFDPLHTGVTPWRRLAYASGTWPMLISMKDEANALLEGHDYDALGRGTTSYVGHSGRDSYVIEYDTPAAGQSRVTHRINGTTNQVTIYALTEANGFHLPSQIDGVCTSCGGAAESQIFTYDDQQRPLSRADGAGNVTRYTYDAAGNVASMTEAFGTPLERTTTYTYGDPARPWLATSVNKPSVTGSGTTLEEQAWNTNETVLTSSVTGRLAPGGSVATLTQTVTYDAKHRIVQTDGPRTDVSDVSSTSYYPDDDPSLSLRGRRHQVTNAAGQAVVEADYDLYGTSRRITDPNGVVTERVTDLAGRVTSTTNKAVSGDPAESADYTTTSTYDSRDRLIETTNARGGKTRFVYEDGTNQVLATVRLNLAGNEVERRLITLDDAGNTTKTEAQSCLGPAATCASWVTKHSESFVYDSKNRQREIVHADGTKILHGYDDDGHLATIQDERHTSPNVTYAYDALDRLATITQTLATAAGGVAITRYGYDANDHLVSVTDPNGNVTTYAYDDFGRMVRQTSPVSGITTDAYDPAGNLTSTTDANGASTTRSYDALGRINSYTATRPGSPAETITWSYDGTSTPYGVGRLRTRTEPTGSTTYEYERRGLLKTERKTIDGTEYVTRFSYDANGNRTAMTYPSGRVVNYGFDYADRPLTASSQSQTLVSSATYLPFGPMTSLVLGNGTTKTMQFDSRYRPTENKLSVAQGVIARYEYAHDAGGNVTEIRDALDAGFNRTFGYDDLNRLNAANTGASLWGNGSYAYDAMGNLTSLSLGTTRNATFSYLGTTPRLATVTENGVNRAVSYDAAGNETAVGTTGYLYGARNHLNVADQRTYEYDGAGVRTVTNGPFNPPVMSALPSNRAAAVAQGTTITWTPTVTGGVAPLQFRFWRYKGSVGTWTIVQDWSTTNTYSWTPTSSDLGYWEVQANVRSAGAADLESYRYTGVTITPGDPAFITAVTPDQASPRPAGSTVTFTPTVTGGVAPLEYRYMRQSASGGPWTVLRDWSTTSTFTWTPGSSDIANWYMQTNVRSAGAVEPDSTKHFWFMVTAGTPPVMSALPSDRGSAVAQGTTITWTPTVTGGVAPLQFRFWRYKGSVGTWTVVQDWSTTNTYSWTPTSADLGYWEVQANVRSAGATSVESYRYTSVRITPGDPAIVSAVTPDLVFPRPAGTTITFTPTVTGGVAPLQYQYLRQSASGGAWTVMRDWSTTPTYTWTPTTSEAATWYMQTAVRSAGAVEPDSIKYYWYVVTVGTPPSMTALTSSHADAVAKDTAITWTPTVSGGVAPMQYRYLRQRGLSGIWTVVQDWSTTSTYTWTPTSSDLGYWEVQANVRSNGATEVESYRHRPVTITPGDPAIISAVSSDVASPQKVGATITWTPVVSGGVTPLQYRFYRANAGVWTLVQDWSASASYTWTPLPGQTGQATIQANVRSSGATDPDSSRDVQMTIVPGATLSAFSADKSTPQPAGTTITWTATASATIPPPQYQFERMDNGVWSVVQAYSSTNTYTWTPSSSDVGEHALRVAVRDSGSAASFEDLSAPLTMVITSGSGFLRSPFAPEVVAASFSLGPDFVIASDSVNPRKYSLYSPELQLLAETQSTTATAPPVAYEYIWFGGQPLAQIETATAAVHYYFNDHLGTPILTTDAAGAVDWRVERDPYGKTHSFRAGATRHQPLSFPGQEDDGSVDRSYNIFRWYRAGWGRYTQADPIGVAGGFNLYIYTANNPLTQVDLLGLAAVVIDQYPSRNQATVTCDGRGKPGPFIGGDFFNSDLQRQCLFDCTDMHERAHAHFIEVRYPTICHGKRAGLIVGLTDRQETYASERQAYLVTMRCLGHRRHCDESQCRQIMNDAMAEYERLMLSGSIVAN